MKPNLRIQKIFRDLWGNKIRTLLVVLTIAVGALTVAMISRTWVLLSRELTANYMATNPASAFLTTANQTFNDDLVDTIRNMPEVGTAEGLRKTRLRVEQAPGKWGSLVLVTLPDYEDNIINRLGLEQGSWPPSSKAVFLERSSLELISAKLGDELLVQNPQGKERKLTFTGIVHHLHQPPSSNSLIAFGYVSAETYQQLTGNSGYNELEIVVAKNPFDKEHNRTVAELVAEKMRKAGLIITEKLIPEPGKAPLDGGIQAVLLLLWALSILALLLSMMLVINIISALLSQQIQQIGTLKALGAETKHIIVMYTFAIIIFGILAWCIAVPLGTFGARFLATLTATYMNFNINSFEFPWWIYVLDIFACIVMPLIAALYPILSATQITVREAMGRTGASSSSFGAGGFEQLLKLVGGLPGPIRYAIRNMFRQKIRLLLTLLTLTLAGSIFITVISVRSSLDVTTEQIAKYWQEDVSIRFPKTHRTIKLAHILADMPIVTAVEGRLRASGFRLRVDGTESDQTIELFGVALPSQNLQPSLIEGRWLEPSDTNSLVMDINFATDEPDIKVGDEITLKIDGDETTWKVVGLVNGQIVGTGRLLAPVAYVNYDHLAETMGEVGRVNRILITTQAHNTASQLEAKQRLEEHFKRVGIPTAFSITNSEIHQALQSVFVVLTSLLLLMTLFFAVVGAMGLTNMMSLNVLERTTEIGIIRVIGGEHSHIRTIVIVEGISVGLLSWFMGALLAVPLSKLLSSEIGTVFIRQPLDFSYSGYGVLIWLVVVIILSVVASLIPAQNASQISVRETLAYE